MGRGGFLDAVRALRRAGDALRRRVRYVVLARWCALSGIANGLPVPPLRLTWLVAGHENVVRSLKNGIRTSENIRDALSRNGLRLEEFPEMLDFGCGSGRVLRNWTSLKATRIYATDYNAEMVDWCRTRLPLARFEKNELHPPLGWADETFAFIYAFSVFTHLNEPLQHAWMAELRRVLKPGGYLMMTTHGEFWLKVLTEAQRACFGAGRLVVAGGDASGSNACGVYHPAGWVREHLATGFSIVDHIPAGATGTGMQDIYLLRRSDLPPRAATAGEARLD